MRKLLRFNIHNLFHSAVFYVFLAILVGWPVLHGLAGQLARLYIAAHNNQPPSLISCQEFEWSTSFSLFLPYVALTFLGIAFAEDYVQDTPKTILARGYSKSAFFFAKWIVLYVAYLVFLVLSRLVPAGVFSLIGGLGYEIGDFFFNFAIYLVVWAANGAIALFFVSLMRKTVSALLVSLFGLGLVSIALSIVHLPIALYHKGLAVYPLDFFPNSWLSLLPSEVGGPKFVAMFVSLFAYIAMSLVFGWLCSRKRDLK